MGFDTSKNRSGSKRITSIIITIGLIGFVYIFADVETLVATLANADLRLLLLAFGTFTIASILRAYRFKILTENSYHYGFLPYVRVTIYHHLILMLLPSRVGEFSYPILMKRYTGRSMAHGMSDLVIARLFDLVLSGIFLGIGAFVLSNSNAMFSKLLIYALIVITLGLVGLIFLSDTVRLGRLGMIQLRRRFSSKKLYAGQRFLRKLDQSVKTKGLDVLFPTFGISLAVTMAAVIRTFLVIAAFHEGISLLGACLIFGAANLLGLIPFRGFGGLGLRQVGTVGIFVLLGLSSEMAVSLTIFSQITAMLFSGSLAGMIYLEQFSRKSNLC